MGDFPYRVSDVLVDHYDKFLKILGLRIDGVEVTQAIQYSRSDRHLTDPAQQGGDNTATLVSGKPAWIRVFVRSSIGVPVTGVTGTVKVSRAQFASLYTEIGSLDPVAPGSITAQTSPDYHTERSTPGASLNFVVPADLMCGRLRFDVTIGAPSLEYEATKSVHVDATLFQTLKMRIMPVGYDGPDTAGTGTTQSPAPTLADAQATAGWSLRVYPVRATPNISLTAATTLTWPLTGTTSPGGCTQGWIDLNAQLESVKIADGNQPGTFYYGLVNGAPVGGNTGCASSNVTAGMVGGGVTMAHEFGHALGWPHAPCGNVGTGDASYPTYTPYPSASTGEYGLDIDTGNVLAPTNSRDFMSYCSPRWISLYHHQLAVGHQLFEPSTICNNKPWWWDIILVDPFWWIRPPEPPDWYDDVVTHHVQPPVDLVSVIGVRRPGGELDVTSVTRARAHPEIGAGEATGLVAELLDAEGRRLSVADVYRLPSHGGCGCGGEVAGTWVFQAFLPDNGRGATLRIVDRDREPRWTLQAPDTPPKVSRFNARIGRDGLRVDWNLTAGGPVEVWVRARSRGGDDPHVLHVGRGPTGKAVIGLDPLTPGPAEIELVVHDGFDISSSDPVAVEIPERPATVVILHPYEHRTLVAGGVLRLNGIATGSDGKPVDPERCRWLLDGKAAGTGPDVWTDAPPEGEHRVTFVADTEAGKAQTTVTFRTVADRG